MTFSCSLSKSTSCFGCTKDYKLAKHYWKQCTREALQLQRRQSQHCPHLVLTAKLNPCVRVDNFVPDIIETAFSRFGGSN